jgi:hypothetical protein
MLRAATRIFCRELVRQRTKNERCVAPTFESICQWKPLSIVCHCSFENDNSKNHNNNDAADDCCAQWHIKNDNNDQPSPSLQDDHGNASLPEMAKANYNTQNSLRRQLRCCRLQSRNSLCRLQTPKWWS